MTIELRSIQKYREPDSWVIHLPPFESTICRKRDSKEGWGAASRKHGSHRFTAPIERVAK